MAKDRLDVLRKWVNEVVRPTSSYDALAWAVAEIERLRLERDHANAILEYFDRELVRCARVGSEFHGRPLYQLLSWVKQNREIPKRIVEQKAEIDRLTDELSTQGVLLTAASASYKIAEHDREKAVTSKAVMREALEGMLEEFDTIFAPEYPRPNEEAAIAKARATIAADKEADKEADGE